MRSFSKLLLGAAVAVAAAVALAPGVAEAQSATANMTVSATVAKSCVVSGPAGAVNFAAYDPVSTAQLSATGTISVRCVRGTGYSVALSSTTGFNMTGAGGAIPYAILQPNGSTSWTTTALVVPAAAITPRRPATTSPRSGRRSAPTWRPGTTATPSSSR